MMPKTAKKPIGTIKMVVVIHRLKGIPLREYQFVRRNRCLFTTHYAEPAHSVRRMLQTLGYRVTMSEVDESNNAITTPQKPDPEL